MPEPNQYRPWEESGETELDYFRRLFLEANRREEAAERLLRAASERLGDRPHLLTLIQGFLAAAPPAPPLPGGAPKLPAVIHKERHRSDGSVEMSWYACGPTRETREEAEWDLEWLTSARRPAANCAVCGAPVYRTPDGYTRHKCGVDAAAADRVIRAAERWQDDAADPNSPLSQEAAIAACDELTAAVAAHRASAEKRDG